MTFKLNIHKALPDDFRVENSELNPEDSTIRAATDQFRVNLMDAHDPDILTMPILAFDQTDVLAQLRKSSHLGENWHLISKDILSPLGVKHRAVVKHKIENAKKRKNFARSAAVEKELRKKMAETQEMRKHKATEETSEQKRRVTWFARSNSPGRSMMRGHSSTIIEGMSPISRNISATPIDIPVNQNYKTTGQMLFQQLLNLSWDQPSVLSLWEMLEAEENERMRIPTKTSLSPTKRNASSRKTSPRETKPGFKILTSTARRKSCECLQCGGISELELRTSHIHIEALKLENSKSFHNTPKILSQVARQGNNLVDVRRDSFRLGRTPSNKASALVLKIGRGLFQNSSNNQPANSFNSKKTRRSRANTQDEENLDKSGLEPHDSNGERTKEDEARPSKRVSLVFDRTPIETPSNANARTKDMINQAFIEKPPDRSIKSQQSSGSGLDRENEADKPQISSTNEDSKQAQKNSNAEESPSMKVKKSDGTRSQPSINTMRIQMQEQQLSQKNEPYSLKTKGLFEILQEKIEESPKIRAKSSSKASVATFSIMNSILKTPAHSNFKAHLSQATPNIRNAEKIRSLQRTQSSFTKKETFSDQVPNNIQQTFTDSSTQSHTGSKIKLRNLSTPKRVRTEMSPGQRLFGVSIEKEVLAAETNDTIIDNNKEETETIPPISLNINKNEDILKVYSVVSSILKPKQPLSKPYPQSPGSKILGLTSQDMTLRLLQNTNHREDARLARLIKSRDQRVSQMSLSQARLSSSVSRLDSKNGFKDSGTFEDDSRVETLPRTDQKTQPLFTSILPESVRSSANRLPIITPNSATAKMVTSHSNLMSKPAYSKIQKLLTDKDARGNKARLKISLSIQQNLSAQ